MDALRIPLGFSFLQLYRWHKITDSYFKLFLKYFHGSQRMYYHHQQQQQQYYRP